MGGRWNPRGAFAAIYLAQPLEACLAELERQSHMTNIPVLARIAQGIELHTVAVTGLHMLDLRDHEALGQVGLTTSDISDEDRTACQAVGHAAYFLEFGGVLAPSATGIGIVATVFESRLRPGYLDVQATRLLTEAEYRQARP
jgi:RES domain-containing protein